MFAAFTEGPSVDAANPCKSAPSNASTEGLSVDALACGLESWSWSFYRGASVDALDLQLLQREPL